jgi:hypothetical protein
MKKNPILPPATPGLWYEYIDDQRYYEFGCFDQFYAYRRWVEANVNASDISILPAPGKPFLAKDGKPIQTKDERGENVIPLLNVYPDLGFLSKEWGLTEWGVNIIGCGLPYALFGDFWKKWIVDGVMRIFQMVLDVLWYIWEEVIKPNLWWIIPLILIIGGVAIGGAVISHKIKHFGE